ncbi:hypothetical protein [Paraburkholderia saeva]|uniref:Uncharacterized protein n=1 Tax=Paraburkholderia saeva TaxID=2777537 RepID=A0A9N8X560_9BURK|nr:hypothetical protein [Paraburkholderia saeva]CAG4919363.1 hypothetical protein LMG31841_04870 [Paraburkholderia saeva]
MTLLVLATLAGCTTVSDITPAGDGHYTVTTQVRGGMTSWGEITASSLKQADEYCRQHGKQMHQVDMQTHGVRGWTPQEAELIFACT